MSKEVELEARIQLLEEQILEMYGHWETQLEVNRVLMLYVLAADKAIKRLKIITGVINTDLNDHVFLLEQILGKAKVPPRKKPGAAGPIKL